MWTITKSFHFSASHQLRNLPEEHQCARLHGHNYLVTLELASDQLDEVGFVVDYGALKSFKTFIDDTLDHRHLNDVLVFNPTSENMAKWLFDLFKDDFPQLSGVVVSETPSTIAAYRP